MAAAAVRLSLLFWIILSLLGPTAAAPPILPSIALVRRAKFIINNATGTPEVFSPDSQQIIPQGTATDAGGTGFNAAALIWLAFCFVVGTPLALAGIRGWRFTTGAGIGLSAAVCSWAAFINSASNVSIPDAVLSAIVIAFFFLGFVLGLFEIGRIAGMATLGVTGGLAFGIRIMIVKEGLLISGLAAFPADWVLTAFLGMLGGLLIVSEATRRAGILFGSASDGTFLVFLGVDLIINRQAGMSRGLRFLFDRNASHVRDIIIAGYKPPLSTQILLAVSLALTPALAYAQHRIFKHPFSRKPRPTSDIGPLDSDVENETCESRFSL
ncbi:putative protein with domain of unknown function (DUF4203) [Lyophyllum shimeji]|uniref:TM7S3/TM198-like domain-containing protein n=1 Tax=Lyophyllum shimeji TaxID=47721 RepID=A0A9P3ULP7_LYOSH|nr:putative protein with domain of unknown function (DUF4203) [Lyophyllum shimeji]